MTKPRLLILSYSNIAADARVLKQVELFAGSYDVTTCGFGESPLDTVSHVRLPDDATVDQRNRNDLILRRYKKMYWGIPAIRATQTALAQTPPFDVILANDIDSVGVALSLKPRLGVHADIHEYAPRQNDEVLIWRVFVAPYVRWMCRTFLPRAASMTTVGGGVADEYRRVFGLTPGIVTNAAPYAELSPSPTGERLRLVHSGAALRNRHIHTMMEAVRRADADIALDLYLMPNDPEYVAELRDLASTSERLTVHDPVPYSKLLATLNDYDAGIHVIPPVNFNNRWSLPNKFFDYIQARLALVIGPSPEMQAVLEANELGVSADGFDIDAITRCLETLTPANVSRWKDNAAAAARPLSSEVQVEVWAAAIAAIVARDRSAR